MMNEIPRAHVGILLVEFSLPDAHSLKDKRQVLKSIKDRVITRFKVAAAEVGYLDKWQRSTIGFCAISNEQKYLDQLMQHILTYVQGAPGAIVTQSHIEFV